MVAIARRIQQSGTGVIYFQPKIVSVSQNNNFTVSVYISAPRPVTAVEVYMSYDSSKLEFVSIDSSSSPFNSTLQEEGSGGLVTIARAKLDASGLNGGVLRISNITFKALAASGTSPIGLSSANAAMNGNYLNPSLSASLAVTFV